MERYCVRAIAAPITGGLSLAAGYLYDQSSQAKAQQKAQNRANQLALQQANAYDLYTWDLANRYNDPSAQMYRLKSAGLNPNLVYGSGNVTGNTSGTAGSNGVADIGVPGSSDFVARGLSMAQSFANLRNTNSQNELLKYQMGQTAAQTAFAKAKTKDLNNFLNGSGNTTYRSVSTQEPSLEDAVVSLAPKGAQPVVSKLLSPAKSIGKYVGNMVANILNPVRDYSYFENKYNTRKYYEDLDNRYKSGKMSQKEYLNAYYF